MADPALTTDYITSLTTRR